MIVLAYIVLALFFTYLSDIVHNGRRAKIDLKQYFFEGALASASIWALKVIFS